jgi:hypothetical protein
MRRSRSVLCQGEQLPRRLLRRVNKVTVHCSVLAAPKGNYECGAYVFLFCRNGYGSLVLVCDNGLCAIACPRSRVDVERKPACKGVHYR